MQLLMQLSLDATFASDLIWHLSVTIWLRLEVGTCPTTLGCLGFILSSLVAEQNPAEPHSPARHFSLEYKKSPVLWCTEDESKQGTRIRFCPLYIANMSTCDLQVSCYFCWQGNWVALVWGYTLKLFLLSLWTWARASQSLKLMPLLGNSSSISWIYLMQLQFFTVCEKLLSFSFNCSYNAHTYLCPIQECAFSHSTGDLEASDASVMASLITCKANNNHINLDVCFSEWILSSSFFQVCQPWGGDWVP